nr:latent-transforming growth factor beta-binding protein 3-like [Lytechinus pictus]
MNSTGSQNCTCEPGFELKNGSCADFDECDAGVDECPPDISTCNNLPGDYNCTCHSGYENMAPKECQDINECELNMDNCNRTEFDCVNIRGNLSCVCKENTTEVDGVCLGALTLSLNVRFSFINGLSVVTYPETIDSQENQQKLAQDVLRYLNTSSELRNDTLQAVSVQNYSLAGSSLLISFRVDLKPDSSLTESNLENIFMELLPSSRLIEPNHEVTPEDINECELFTDVCSNGNCTNTDGSYFCTCSVGFQLGNANASCIDINECLRDHGCNQTCINSPGNYSCSCDPGFELDDDGFTCSEPIAHHTPVPVPIYWRDAVRAGLYHDVQLGEPVTWCHRMVVCAKKNGKPRRNVDFQALNAHATRETHHTQSPFLQARSVPHGKKKTVCGAWNGYHSVPICQEDRHLTTFITPWGRYHYKTAPQGYIASGDGYTRRYDEIVSAIPYKTKCVDDVLLWVDTADSFFQAVEWLDICGRKGIILNPTKFTLGADVVEFAGFEITTDSVRPCQKYLQAILDFPAPSNITDVRSWFGLVNQVSYAFSMRNRHDRVE